MPDHSVILRGAPTRGEHVKSGWNEQEGLASGAAFISNMAVTHIVCTVA